MGTVRVLTQEEMAEIRDETVVNATVNEDGYLILTRFDGSTVNAGYVKGSSTPESVGPTALHLMKRDSAGRSQVEDPVADKDVVNKLVLDTNIQAALDYADLADAYVLNDAIDYVDNDAGDNAVSNNTLLRRGASGNAAVANATSSVHAVPKGQMDIALGLKVANTKITKKITAGSSNYTPDPKLLFAFVQVKGGGGGTGGAAAAASGANATSGGGGGGGYAEAWLSLAEITAALVSGVITVTVGSAGTAGSTSGAGGDGGDSSFGALITAAGGSGSAFGTSSSAALSSRQAGGGGGFGGTAASLRGCPGSPGDAGRGGVNYGAGGNGGAAGDGSGGGRGALSNSGGNSLQGTTPLGSGGGAGGSLVTSSGSAAVGKIGTVGEVVITEFIAA